MAAGADGFECDVRLSADGVPVVIHDPTLDRTTDATGPVHTRTADELGRVDARCRFVPAEPAFAVTEPEGVPTLEAALTRFPGARVIIEIKDESPRLAEIVAALVSTLDAAPRVCIGSFHQAVLDRVREVAPDVTTSASRREAQWTLAWSWLRLAIRGAAALPRLPGARTVGPAARRRAGVRATGPPRAGVGAGVDNRCAGGRPPAARPRRRRHHLGSARPGRARARRLRGGLAGPQ